MPFGGDVGLEGMGQGVDPSQRGHFGGLGQGQQGIQDRDGGRGLGIPAGHLHVGLGIADQGERLGFAPGPGRRRNRNQGKHRFAGFTHSPVVCDFAAAAIEKIDPFGAVHARAAAEADDEIRGPGAGDFQSAVDVVGGGVFAEAVEPAHLDPGAFERPDSGVVEARSDDPGVAHHERLGPPKFPGQRSQAFDRPFACDDSGS